MRPVGRSRGTVRVAAIVGLALAAAGLQRLGDGWLTVPLHSVDQLSRWAQDTPTAMMAVAVIRLAALGACAYLVLALTLLVVADAAGWRRLAGMAARALPATVRCAVTGGARFSLAAGVVVGAASPVTAAPGSLGGDAPPPTATMWRLDSTGDSGGRGATATATMVLLGPIEPGEPTLSTDPSEPANPDNARHAEADATTTAEPTAASPEATSAPRPAMDPAAARQTVDTWEVGAGDCFWSIAEVVVSEAAGQTAPSAPDIGRYWSRLVEANRDRLAAPDHPDLLIPGQLLVLPHPS